MKQDPKEIIITRTFNAPKSKVWKAWTDTKLIEQWYGPQGFTTRVEKNDLKTGGRFRYVMIGPDGKEYPSEGTVLDIKKEEKIVSTDEFGEDFKAPKGMDLPQGMISTVLFEENNGKTTVTIRIMHPSVEEKTKHENMGVIQGYNSQLDKLVDLLKKNEMKRKTTPYKHYHRDGSLYATGTLDGDVLEGHWKWYRKDGTIMRSGNFKKGKQTGHWITYDKTGKIVKKTQMKEKL